MSDGSSLPEVEFVFEAPGASGWRPVHVFLRERMSKHYEAALVLATTNLDANIDECFEQNASLEMSRASQVRNLRGWVRQVEDLGTTGAYRFARVHLVPQLYKLSHRVNSRIWQHVNVLVVVREVLRDAGLYQGEGGLEIGPGLDALPVREYCVQYRESDLDFVMRLLQEEGVPFFFKHEGAVETLVLAGENQAWEQAQTLDGVISVSDSIVATASSEMAQWFDWHRKTHSTGVVLRDFDFTHPRAFLEFTHKAPSDAGARQVYDYPARYNLGTYNEGGHAYSGHDGARASRLRNEELRYDEYTGRGRSNAAGFMPGTRFTLQGHLREAIDGDWLLLSVEHEGIAWGDIPDETRTSQHMRAILAEAAVELSSETPGRGDFEHRYTNRFACIPAAVQLRPVRETSRPLVYGPQTATVMAEPGSDDEICVDHHGRILVRFHWERPELRPGSQRGKNASCWIRVAQSWAGAAWGTMFIPRVGMEVVVTFLEGDPDRPLVTGCVYNGENHVPYTLPDEKTKSVIKTLTSPGGNGFNELRFEDQKDREQIFVHAQRDHDTVVRRNQTLLTGGNRQKTIQGEESITVVKDRTTEVQGDERFLIQGDRNVRINGGKGYAINVVKHFSLNGDASVKFTCGDSSIEMLPDKITIASKTVHVLGSSLVNIDGKLVTINCGDNPGGAKADKNDVEAAQPLELQGEPGDLLSRIKDLLRNPEALVDQATKALDKVLTKAGVSEKIRTRLTSVVKDAANELVSALKEGRRPNFGKIAEKAITDVVKIGVNEVFAKIENIPAVKKSKVLSGLVKEAKGISTTAATYGVLYAAGLREGLAKDPFTAVLQNRHGESLRAFLNEVGLDAATRVVHGAIGHLANAPLFERNPALRQKILDFLIKAAKRGVERGVDRVVGLLPG